MVVVSVSRSHANENLKIVTSDYFFLPVIAILRYYLGYAGIGWSMIKTTLDFDRKTVERRCDVFLMANETISVKYSIPRTYPWYNLNEFRIQERSTEYEVSISMVLERRMTKVDACVDHTPQAQTPAKSSQPCPLATSRPPTWSRQRFTNTIPNIYPSLPPSSLFLPRTSRHRYRSSIYILHRSPVFRFRN